MAKPLALIINATDSPLAGIAKLVAARDCSGHVSRSIAEAERYIREIYAPFGKLTNAQWAHLTRHSLQKIDGGRYALAYDPGIVEPLKEMQRADFHIWPLWDRIRCPVLVLRGKESDVLLASTLEEMKRRGPRIEVVEIDGVGHAPTLTDPKHVRIVRDWLLR